MEADQTEFDEVEYFTDIAKIRYYIARLMRNHNLIDKINPVNGILDAFYVRVDRNPKAVFAVEFLDDTIPGYLYTPYGSLEINPFDAEQLRITSAFLPIEDKTRFLSDLRKKLEMVEIQPCIIDPVSGVMKQPAIYGITKLPWKENIFNQRYYIQARPKDPRSEALVAEAQHVAAIFAKVNEKLKELRHPEVGFSDELPKKQKLFLSTPSGRESY